MALLGCLTLIISVILFVILLVDNSLCNRLFDVHRYNRFVFDTGSRSGTRRCRKLCTKLLNRSRSVFRENLESIYKSVDNICRKLFGKLARNHKPVISYTFGCVDRIGSDKGSVKHSAKPVNIRPCALSSVKAVLLKRCITVVKLAFKLASCRSDLADAESCYSNFTVRSNDKR